MREFNYTIQQALSVGLRSSDRNKRNVQGLVLSTGVYPDEKALGSLEQLSPIDVSSLDPVPVFPYPQIFELLQGTLVCTDVAIYEYSNETLTLLIDGLISGHRWSIADFGAFLVLANGRQTVHRDATSREWSVADTYGIGCSSGVCDLNGQLIVVAPSTELYSSPIIPPEEPPEEPSEDDDLLVIIGTTYYVSASGDDLADGLTTATAWKTVSRVNGAGSLLIPGDGVLFNRGDAWNDQLIIPKSGDATGDIAYGAYGTGAKPLFDGDGSSYSETYGGFVKAVSKSYITIDNFEINNVAVGAGNNNAGISLYNVNYGNVTNCKISHTDGAGIKANVGSNITFDGNEVEYACKNSNEESMSVRGIATAHIHNNHIHHDWRGDIDGGLGIDVKAGCSNVLVEANVLHHLNPNALYVDAGQTAGMDTTNIRFTRNFVYDTYGPAMMIASEGAGNLSNVTVDHNVLVGAVRGGIVFHDKSSGDNSGTVSGIKIYNNTFYLNGSVEDSGWGGGRIFDPLLHDAVFKNNIFTDGVHFQLGYKADKLSVSVLTVATNVIYGDQIASGGYTPLNGTGAIQSDPLFVDPGIIVTSDFTLQAGSPAEDAGDVTVWAGTPDVFDFAGTRVTDEYGNIVLPGGTVNCGAIE